MSFDVDNLDDHSALRDALCRVNEYLPELCEDVTDVHFQRICTSGIEDDRAKIDKTDFVGLSSRRRQRAQILDNHNEIMRSIVER